MSNSICYDWSVKTQTSSPKVELNKLVKSFTEVYSCLSERRLIPTLQVVFRWSNVRIIYVLCPWPQWVPQWSSASGMAIGTWMIFSSWLLNHKFLQPLQELRKNSKCRRLLVLFTWLNAFSRCLWLFLCKKSLT